MTTANPLWGAPRIHGELGKLGITVSKRTVARAPASTSMDFLTVPTLTGRVLFVLVMLSHQCRRIIHLNITEHLCLLKSAILLTPLKLRLTTG